MIPIYHCRPPAIDATEQGFMSKFSPTEPLNGSQSEYKAPRQRLLARVELKKYSKH